jgi:F0F1-type ATP synthase assembly protein I
LSGDLSGDFRCQIARVQRCGCAPSSGRSARFAVVEPSQENSPLAAALAWVSRIMTVAIEMAVPGLLGWWLDRRWGTSFCGLIGVGIGFATGFWHLLVMTGVAGRKRQGPIDETHKPRGERPPGDKGRQT